MNEGVQQILSVLQELLDEHRQLVAYSKAKTEVIRKNDLDGISYISGKEKKIAQRIQELEQARIALVDQYIVGQKMPASRPVTLDMLIQVVTDPAVKKRLEGMLQDMSAVVMELRDINDLNQTLVRMTLEYVDFTQDLLFGPQEEDVTYHRAVQEMTNTRGGRFNAKM